MLKHLKLEGHLGKMFSSLHFGNFGFFCTEGHCHNGTGFSPLVPKGNPNTTAYRGFLDNWVLPPFMAAV